MPWTRNGCWVSDLLAKRILYFLNSHGDGLISIATGFSLLPFPLTGRNTRPENARLFWVFLYFQMLVHFLDNVLKYKHLHYIFVSTFWTGSDIISHPLLLRFVMMWVWSILFCFLSSYSSLPFQFSVGQPAMQGDDCWRKLLGKRGYW